MEREGETLGVELAADKGGTRGGGAAWPVRGGWREVAQQRGRAWRARLRGNPRARLSGRCH
jgi:hypothetical protein